MFWKRVCAAVLKQMESLTAGSNLSPKEALYAELLQLDKYINTEKPPKLG